MRLKRNLEIEDANYRQLEANYQRALLAEAKEPIYLVMLDPPSVAESPESRDRFLKFGGVAAVLGFLLSLALSLYSESKKEIASGS